MLVLLLAADGIFERLFDTRINYFDPSLLFNRTNKSIAIAAYHETILALYCCVFVLCM